MKGRHPLAGPEKGVARSNALKSLDAKSFRRFASRPPISPGPRRATGSADRWRSMEPHAPGGRSDHRGSWRGLGLSTQVKLTQSDFGVKPYSLFMGSLKVADKSPSTSPRRTRSSRDPTHQLMTTGSPMPTWLKYHSALLGLRLMQPWLTLA